MDAHHQQSNAANMHQQHTQLEQQRNPEKKGGTASKASKKRKRNQDLGPGAPRQPVNGNILQKILLIGSFKMFYFSLQAMSAS